ncbi:hypothetical protein V6N11_013974 [Hibiscus sabdariffa]|uniref:Uncharacterized protein n=1 Tax=Hibiscus sabdariffa TaxID=183260 RepID=A0ABR1ZAK0_9ROSI
MYLWSLPARLLASPPISPPQRSPNASRSKSGVPLPSGPGVSNAKPTKPVLPVRNALLPGSYLMFDLEY